MEKVVTLYYRNLYNNLSKSNKIIEENIMQKMPLKYAPPLFFSLDLFTLNKKNNNNDSILNSLKSFSIGNTK